MRSRTTASRVWIGLAVCAGLWGPAAGQSISVVVSDVLDDGNTNAPYQLTYVYSRTTRNPINMARSSCGAFGVVYHDVRGSVLPTRVIFLEENPVTGRRGWILHQFSGSDVEYKDPGIPLYDRACAPHVFRETNSILHHHWRGPTGFIDEVVDLAGGLGETVTRTTLHSAVLGQDGGLHVFHQSRLQSGTEIFVRSTWRDGVWTHVWIADLPTSSFSLFNLQVDAAGAVHAVFRKDHPDYSLHYGKWSGGAWATETIDVSTDIDFHYNRGSFLALKRDGTPATATSFSEHHDPGGSIKRSKLIYYVRKATGGWTKTSLVETADGYVGADGNNYTGEQPHLVFDANDRPHIVFCDLASWHEPLDIGGGQTVSANITAQGQIRYFYLDGATWRKSTFFQQPGQTVSPAPIHELFHPQLAVSPGGSEVFVAGVERQTEGGSPQYEPDRVQRYKMRYFKLSNTYASEPPAGAFDIVNVLLGRALPSANADRDGNSAIDPADLMRAMLGL